MRSFMLRFLSPLKILSALIFCVVCGLVTNSAFSQNTPEKVHSVDNFLKEKDQRAISDDKNSSSLTYDDITGSPFYKPNYETAALYKNGKRVGTVPIKINFFTNEIYCVQGEKEVVVEDHKVDSLVFFNTPDSATFTSGVANLLWRNRKVEAFVQILNKGDWKLLKSTRKELLSSDAGLSHKKYSFSTEYHYFLQHKQKVERIKRLDRETLLSYLPSSDAGRKWIEANKPDFSKEQDVVAFLNYYHTESQGY
jgi:hypothetical protein